MADLHLLKLDGCWLMIPTQHASGGGGRFTTITPPPGLCPMVGAFNVEQVSVSTASRGMVRGIHYTTNKQRKIVTCVVGEVLDVVVDLRLDSPTFGQWDSARLDDANRAAMIVGAGMGHGYCVLTPQATLLYLLSAAYDPGAEREIHPLDPELGIAWPARVELSARDANAPLLASLREVR